jgi:hypothetical protein
MRDHMRDRMRSPRILLASALLFLPVLAAGSERCDPRFLLRKVVSGQGRRPDHTRGFTRSRDLLEYLRSFPPEVGEKIAKLDGKGLILDAGAGEAIAAEQLLQSDLESLLLKDARNMKEQRVSIYQAKDPTRTIQEIGKKPVQDRPTVLALSKEMDRTLDTAPYRGKLKLLTGHFLEDLPAHSLGKPDLILEHIGVFSYTENPSVVLKKYLDVLKPNGDIYLIVDRSAREEGQRTWSRPNLGRSTVEVAPGRRIDLFEWLHSLHTKGIEVRELQNPHRVYYEEEGVTRYIDYSYHSFHIRKTSGAISIPELKLIDADTSENPPRRLFRVVDGARSSF